MTILWFRQHVYWRRSVGKIVDNQVVSLEQAIPDASDTNLPQDPKSVSVALMPDSPLATLDGALYTSVTA